MNMQGRKTTIIAAIAALGLWAGSTPLAAETGGVAPYQPKGILAVWAQGRGQAHIDMLRHEFEGLNQTRGADTEPYLPKAILAVWAQGRGQAHIDMLRHEFEGLDQSRGVDTEPYLPKGILAVWAQGRGQAHIDMLRHEYERVSKDLVSRRDERGDAGHI